MIASMLYLTRADIKALKIKDVYSLHRVIYSLFEDVRSDHEKHASQTSGILYADKGGDYKNRKILILSNRLPGTPVHGEIKTKTVPESFLQYDHYGFEVIMNPTKRDKNTGKTVAICGREAITKWFISKAPKSWGFTVNPENLQIQSMSVQCFEKGGHAVTQGKAIFKGELTVLDRELFIKKSFEQGIGRGRAFGFGLLQIIPLSVTNIFNI